MFDQDKRAFVAISGKEEICLIPKMANRHGLITGATGTGKTVTLQTMAETFSEMGVPVFAADVKGDLSGVAGMGGNKDGIVKRVKEYGLEDKGFRFKTFPVQFWDLLAEQGVPVRATIADMGPLLLSRLLMLNETQSDVLTIIFKIASDESLEIVDLKDLQKLLEYVGANKSRYSVSYGNISSATLGSIQRGLITLEHDGAGQFFGEPNLDINDLIRTDNGMGVINILASDKLMTSPKLYTSFLMWLMNKLFVSLPEVGDMDKPKLVFFFDEAHLLFNDASKALLGTIEQVVRLIRSKGVGIYFISQTPSDIPDSVLGQLGNRIQHALRAYTPKDQKALKAAAQSFRANSGFDTEKAISELGVGEALVSFLDEKGTPQPVERANILPPEGQVGPLDPAARNGIVRGSLLYGKYETPKDRSTAFEQLSQHLDQVQSDKDETLSAKEKQNLEKQKRTEEKEERQDAERQRRFFSSLLRSIMPLLKELIMSMLKGSSRR